MVKRLSEKSKGWLSPFSNPTGLFIRDYLKEHGEGYSYEIWSQLKFIRMGIKVGTYDSFRFYIYCLKKLGLIEEVRREPSKIPKLHERIYYRIVKGKENNHCWLHPQKCMKKERKWGRK